MRPARGALKAFHQGIPVPAVGVSRCAPFCLGTANSTRESGGQYEIMEKVVLFGRRGHDDVDV